MENIRLSYEFDFVHDTQKVFRHMLQAISNPGTFRDLGEEASRFQSICAPLVVLGCTVLDNEKKMYVERNQKLDTILHDLTLCNKGEVGNADYVFLSSMMNYGSMKKLFANVKNGTYADPQDSATIFILCDTMEGEERVILKGPGIKEELKLGLDIYVKRIIELRQEQQMEYPLGIDLFFVSKEGKLMGIPRLCRIENDKKGEQSWHM